MNESKVKIKKFLCCTRQLQTSKEPLESQVQSTSLLKTAVQSSQRGCPRSSQKKARVQLPDGHGDEYLLKGSVNYVENWKAEHQLKELFLKRWESSSERKARGAMDKEGLSK